MAAPLVNTQPPANGVDPNVRVPASVQAIIDRGNQIHSQTFGPSGDPPPNGAAATPNGAAPAVGAPPPTPVVGTPPPVAPNGNPPADPEPLPTENEDGTPNWENRYKAMKGRYDQLQRRANETQQEHEQRIRDLQAAANPRQPLPGEGEITQLVTAKEIEDFGPDLIDVIKRAAQEAILPLLKPIATTVGQVQAQVETTQQETGRQFLNRMHTSMDAAVPGWQDLNKDENFIAWTKRADVYSGLNRQELLQKAWNAGDANRVAAFFQGYLAEEAATDPAAAQARAQALAANGGHAPLNAAPASPAAAPAPQRVTLEQLAAPGRARQAATPPPAGKPVWTAAGISQFYMDVAQGRFNGREAERLATEADLMAAQREGRIQIDPRTATSIGTNR